MSAKQLFSRGFCIVVIWLLATVPSVAQVQVQKVDSLIAAGQHRQAVETLENVLDTVASDSAKVKLLRKYARNFEKRNAVTEQCRCLYLLASHQPPRAKAATLRKIISILERKKDFIYLGSIAKISEELSEITGNKKDILTAARRNLRAGIAVLSGFNLPTGITESFSGAGFALLFSGILGGKYMKAKKYIEKAIDLYERGGKTEVANKVRVFLAVTNLRLSEYSQAAEIFEKLWGRVQGADAEIVKRGLAHSLLYSTLCYPVDQREGYLKRLRGHFPDVAKAAAELLKKRKVTRRLAKELQLDPIQVEEIRLMFASGTVGK